MPRSCRKQAVRTSTQQNQRVKALAAVGNSLFGDKKFTEFQTFVGIVATNWTAERPLIFKSSIEGSYNLKGSFEPGFGCTISQAVQASCSASPFFEKCILDLGRAGIVECRDGGFAANNPALFAINDALKAFGRSPDQIRLLTLGVGHYPEPKKGLINRLLRKVPSAHLLQKTLSVNANTTEKLVNLLCDNIRHVRVSDTFESPELATDFLEWRQAKLELLIQKGRDSFGSMETEVQNLFDNYGKS